MNLRAGGSVHRIPPAFFIVSENVDKPITSTNIVAVLDAKLSVLRELIRGYGSCLVAYSGGVDSVFLAKVAHEVLGARALAAIADSPSLPRRELAEALELAERFGFSVRVISTAEFDNAEYLQNPVNRCYFCKHALFSELEPLARQEGFAAIAYGENASDVGDHRPGAQAATEFRVTAPLKEAGLTKSDIRQLSARIGLPTADKPQLACLSSRIPTGERVTPEKLRMIEESEYFLRDAGCREVRVRHHEQGGGHLARIELGTEEFARFLTDGFRQAVTEHFRRIGYSHVTLDLQGYRRGSTNGTTAAIPMKASPPARRN